MSKKLRVALIYGGPSAEYDVSLNSARAIRDNLSRKKYSLIDVHITKDEVWVVDGEKQDQNRALEVLKTVDLAVLAVHGTFGEDGKLQKLLDDHEIVFTGSGAEASALAMDKVRAGNVFAGAGLLVPKTFIATTAEEAEKVSKNLDLPLVVKPVSQGSSVGVSIVREAGQLKEAVKLAFQHDQQIIIQEFIAGREVSCGVLEVGGSVESLPPTELIPAEADFFDYHAKYTPGATNEVTPPEMPEKVIKHIQDLAIKAHQAIGCQDYSRTDMFVRGDEIFLIEINTLPGMTETSILPQQAAAAGISFQKLIDTLIQSALARGR